MRRLFPIFPLLILLALSANAKAELVVTSTSGQTHEADGYSTFNTSSSDMVGMRVDVFFADGTSDSAIWASNGINQNGWQMTQGPGSSFSNPFDLRNLTGQNILRFRMHGAGSRTIFDRSVFPSTSGTANGRDLQEFTFLRFSQDILVTYFDEVQTVGSTAVGDIFAGVDVSFETGIAGNNGRFQFRMDTDTTINNVRVAIPEPTTAIQFSLLLLGALVRRRRRPAPHA